MKLIRHMIFVDVNESKKENSYLKIHNILS